MVGGVESVRTCNTKQIVSRANLPEIVYTETSPINDRKQVRVKGINNFFITNF